MDILDNFFLYEHCLPDYAEHVLVSDGYHYQTGTWFGTSEGGFLMCDEADEFDIIYWYPLSTKKEN